eukprot:681878-Prymnesium_polylepis.1
MGKPSPEEVIRRVISSSSVFQALGLARDSDDKQVHHQYKRISLLVHPDKCALHEATEAFQRLHTLFEQHQRGDAEADEEPGDVDWEDDE